MADTRRLVLRVLAVVLGGFWLFVAFVAGSFTGWSSESLGWLWSGLAFAVGLVLAVLLWRPRNRRFPLAAAAAAALVLGLVHWQSSPPTHDRIADHADEVELPDEWEMTFDSDYGNTWCFKGCPAIERTYTVPGSYADAMTEATAAFESAGWTGGPLKMSPYSLQFRDGRWRATVTEAYPPEGPTEVRISFSG